MRAIVAAVLIAVVLVAGEPAFAAAPPPVISADLVARLCPVTGIAGLKLGATRDEQPSELLRSMRSLPDSFRPFTDAEVETTAWSGRVAAVTYRAASPDGEVNDALLESFDETMTAAGWAPVVLEHAITPLSVLGGHALAREVDGPQGKQKLLLEFDASGALALRCGDPELLELDQRERDGTLEPGTARPVEPAYDPTLRLPEPAVCQSPGLEQIFAAPGTLNEDAPELAQFAAASVQESDRAHFAKRLNVWLEWKLLNSGKVDDSRLVKLREQAAKQDVDGQMGQMMGFLAAGGDMMKAQEAGNAVAACEAMRRVMGFTYDKARQGWAYWSRVNAALEGEAKRLGVAVEQ